MAGRLQGKAAVITGASRGIGKGVARVFAAEGARVLIVGRNEQAGNRAAEELRQAGGEVAFCGADVSRRADAERMAREAVDRFGQLDILVSNAGIFPSAKIEDMTEADWDHVQAVNLKGTFLAVQACFARMLPPYAPHLSWSEESARRASALVVSSSVARLTGAWLA